MIVYRCTGCTHDHVQLTPQGMNDPKCERCGRTSFATIHLPDVIDADFDEGPPVTPRDMPAGALAETIEVARLRPVEHKPREVCSQVNCDDRATHRFTWPGHPEASACFRHAQAATRLAEAMGFFLEAPALES